jgi:hypothetical protein
LFYKTPASEEDAKLFFDNRPVGCATTTGLVGLRDAFRDLSSWHKAFHDLRSFLSWKKTQKIAQRFKIVECL